jgi:hypothetical protein
MTKREARRTHREFTPEERAHWEQARDEAERELPEVLDRAKRRTEALMEPTMSGQIRRAIQASEFNLSELADRIGISPVELSGFMSGDQPLSSDVLDSLAALLGYELVPR